MLADPMKREDHPWGETLALYEHWGPIGGALAAHRADCGRLRNPDQFRRSYVIPRRMADSTREGTGFLP
jgi:hypothetical protein